MNISHLYTYIYISFNVAVFQVINSGVCVSSGGPLGGGGRALRGAASRGRPGGKCS